MLRSLRTPSGMSGSRTRVSITKKPAISTAAAASRPSVSAESQPFLFPFTIA